MKRVTFSRVISYCAAVLVAHAVLLVVVQRTGAVEKLMAGTFSKWELALILAFIGCRLATYLVVPPVMAGIAVHALARRFLRRSQVGLRTRNPPIGLA